uniref:Eukaryotic translation initiation factor 3 30 kDa subunit n=1 Tax=Rhodosorus marinus TaxID=101924 RepID=A0A7S0G7Z8_9RHOD|mmetsp:Transcript_9673/g.14100  ORF Transcript_9673/g.14100 Transcript_9673/m.14100 type:complete len:228 (+) Transcript_9673:154-837(+)|eukprot:CAMPEP_0184737600 /NCGR_PEP_ID=MMETSP0315-20130426/392_1 /TAXON_ID=101924 /ORGANISM="Rhodosorus marinus, Strain UTEX LB 2760" /LENGTH=227 /DNA_ID=CAMNT_0027204887 /DNA_START=75 /DNA_END=758 /DNA_ORIENTATION=+
MNWEDEEEEFEHKDVKANWDDEDEEEEPEEAPPAEPSQMSARKKKEKDLQAKIKEREEREAQYRAAQRKQEIDMEALTDAEKKLARQKLVEEADFQNAKDMFMHGDSSDVKAETGKETLDGMSPKGSKELKKYCELLVPKLNMVMDSNVRSHRLQFFKDVLRGITADLSVDDTKELSSHLNVISNEKIQVNKGPQAKKGKAKKKTTVKMERSQVLDAYVDDELDGFM